MDMHIGDSTMTTVSNRAYIGRQPILDINRRVVGHELLYRHDGDTCCANVSDEFEACANIVTNTLTNMNAEWLLGDGAAFINITPELLDADPLKLLPSRRVVLELEVPHGKHAKFPDRLREVRNRGFRIALEDILPSRQIHPVLDSADYVKLDVQRFDTRTLAKAVELFRHYPLKLIAKKVETMQEYLACVELGFDYFQGYFLARPETLSVKVINPASATIFELLNKISANADIAELDECFKQNLALTYKLLRYMNSAGFALNAPVDSIRHALTLLGHRQLYRWLSLLLITSDNTTASPALVQMAMARGRFVELLGQESLQGIERDNLFIAGMFSMLDVILETPLENALNSLNLPTALSEALLHRRGVYAPFLNLVEASENLDWEKVEYFSATLRLSAKNVNQAHFDALVWAEQLAAI